MKEPKSFDLWVTQVYYHSDMPNVEHYKALSLGPTGAKVKIRGSTTFIRAASGRQFFTEKNKLDCYMLKNVTARRDAMVNKAAALSTLIEALDWMITSTPPDAKKEKL